MLTPSKQTIQGHIETLKSIWSSLSPSEEVAKIMLADALKGEELRGMHGSVQRKLLLLHTAQMEIENAIAMLINYQSLN